MGWAKAKRGAAKCSAGNNKTIKHICFVPPPKGALVYMYSWFRTTVPALGQPMSHIQNQVTVLALKADEGCDAAEKRGLSRLSAFDMSIHHPDSVSDARHVCVCVCVSSHLHLICSLLMKPWVSLSFSFSPSSSTPNFFSPLTRTRWTFLSDTLIYFCSSLPLSSFCLSSFSPWPGLMQLLLPHPSCSATLSPPSASLPLLHFLSAHFLKFLLSSPFLACSSYSPSFFLFHSYFSFSPDFFLHCIHLLLSHHMPLS